MKLITINIRNIQDKFWPKPLLYEKNFCAKKNLIYIRMNSLELPRIKTVLYGIQSAVFLGSSLWLTVPDEAKNSRTIDEVKNVITHWTGQENCRGRKCRQYKAQVGFLT